MRPVIWYHDFAVHSTQAATSRDAAVVAAENTLS
jgi:hypothetical protein